MVVMVFIVVVVVDRVRIFFFEFWVNLCFFIFLCILIGSEYC